MVAATRRDSLPNAVAVHHVERRTRTKSVANHEIRQAITIDVDIGRALLVNSTPTRRRSRLGRH